MSSPVFKPVFSDAALQAQIDKVVEALPADKQGALIVHGDLSGVNVTVVQRLGDGGWTIDAGASYRFGGSWSAEANVSKTW